MAKKRSITRRNFIGTMAVGGTSVMTGCQSESTPEVAPRDTPSTVTEDENVHYFGYGSNLNVSATIEDLIPKGKFLMKAYLPNYEVQFRKWSNNYRGGISNIVEVPGELVQGAMYECPEGDLTALDYRLDYYVPEYKRETFLVRGEDGKWYSASLYRLWEPKGPFPPSRRYVEGMLEGAKQIGLSPDYIEKIEGFLRDSIVAPD